MTFHLCLCLIVALVIFGFYQFSVAQKAQKMGVQKPPELTYAYISWAAAVAVLVYHMTREADHPGFYANMCGAY